MPVRGEHAGLSDLFVPIVVGDHVPAVLAVGPYQRSYPVDGRRSDGSRLVEPAQPRCSVAARIVAAPRSRAGGPRRHASWRGPGGRALAPRRFAAGLRRTRPRHGQRDDGQGGRLRCDVSGPNDPIGGADVGRPRTLRAVSWSEAVLINLPGDERRPATTPIWLDPHAEPTTSARTHRRLRVTCHDTVLPRPGLS
jgi:hypothetical protein